MHRPVARPPVVRTAVLATSNGVLKDGFVRALSADPRIEVTANLSLGMSQSLVTAVGLSRLEARSVDCVVHELFVSEADAACRGNYDAGVTHRSIRDLARWCAGAGVRLVGLLLPTVHLIDAAEDDPVLLVRRDFARAYEQYGIEYLDIAHDARSELSFLDDLHLDPPSAAIVGASLADLVARGGDPPTVTGSAARSFTFLGAAAFGAAAVDRKTRLTRARMVSLADGSTIHLPQERLPDGYDTVAGVVLNITRSSGVLVWTGAETVSQPLTSKFSGAEQPLVLSAWSLPRPCRAGGSGFSLRLRAGAGGPARAEIAGVVLARTEEEV